MELSKTQLNIIETPSESRQLIITGPGTGKTHCLIERIKYLVNEEDLNPATEILILSFSVAAVREIKNRLEKAVENGDCDEFILYANIRTFDSFASYFMIRADPDIELTGKDYDERIRMAAEMITEKENARHELKKFKHIFVDEIQDLVGSRAFLTQTIIQHCECGFSLFGDPAQAIYDYLISEEEEGPDSEEFLMWVKSNVKNLEIFDNLTKNWRTQSNFELEQIADEGRTTLFTQGSIKAYQHLRKAFSDLISLGKLNEPQFPKEICDNQTAVLCRTNGQLLCLAKNLYERDIKFTIRRRNEERIIPPWVGRIFCRWQHSRIQKSRFAELYSSKLGNCQLSWEDAWDQLKYSEGRRTKNIIDIHTLRHSLLYETVYLESVNQTDHREAILISTIHRAKGREFDRVIVVMPDIPIADENEASQEARVMYVALTRAKNQLYRMSEKGSRGFRKIKPWERWIRSYGKKISAVEIGIDGDFDPHSSVSLGVHEGDIEDIRENQEDLWSCVYPRIEAKLRFNKFEAGIPLYLIKVKIKGDFVVVGATSKKFGFSLRGCLEKVKNRRIGSHDYPRVIDKIWVRETSTEIGDLGKEIVPREFRTTGLWLGARLEGIGQCHW